MAELYLFNGRVNPDNSGNVYDEDAADSLANDLIIDRVWVFEDTATKIGLHGSIVVPSNYAGTSATLKVRWYTTGITGNFQIDFDYRSIAVGESNDPSTFQESVTVADAADGTARNLNEASIALTASNLAAGDEFKWILSRDGVNESSGVAAKCYVVEAWIDYAAA